MQGIQDETKAELLEDASKAGVSPEEFLMQQMAALNVRAQEFQKSYSGGRKEYIFFFPLLLFVQASCAVLDSARGIQSTLALYLVCARAI